MRFVPVLCTKSTSPFPLQTEFSEVKSMAIMNYEILALWNIYSSLQGIAAYWFNTIPCDLLSWTAKWKIQEYHNFMMKCISCLSSNWHCHFCWRECQIQDLFNQYFKRWDVFLLSASWSSNSVIWLTKNINYFPLLYIISCEFIFPLWQYVPHHIKRYCNVSMVLLPAKPCCQMQGR